MPPRLIESRNCARQHCGVNLRAARDLSPKLAECAVVKPISICTMQYASPAGAVLQEVESTP
jgi:hypothetical protein